MSRLLSLLDIMNRFQLDRFMAIFGGIQHWASLLGYRGATSPEMMVTEEMRKGIQELLGNLSKFCSEMIVTTPPPFPTAFAAFNGLMTDFKLGQAMTYQVMAAKLTYLCQTLIHDCQLEYKFVSIPKDLSSYFEQSHLMGDSVHNAFTHAHDDIKSAGNCLAVGLNTAAVFHLMRVAEYGLRALAKRVKVKLIDHGKPQPIEYATWNKVLDGIRIQITASHKLPKTASRERKLQFYSDMAEHCTYLRDLFRNEISHTRKTYNYGEAVGAKQRVQSFMEKLAEGLK